MPSRRAGPSGGIWHFQSDRSINLPTRTPSTPSAPEPSAAGMAAGYVPWVKQPMGDPQALSALRHLSGGARSICT